MSKRILLMLLLTAATLSMAAERHDPIFRDVTDEAGVNQLTICGAATKEKGWIVEYMGSGVAWLDYDGDGNLDLYVVNGSQLDREPGEGEPNQLYRGNGKGHFENVTAKAGVGHRGWGYGVNVGDTDNDGDPDIYVTNLGPNVLYRNNGDGTFTDITTKAGVGHSSWGTASAFFDMENDGDLDLIVGNYVEFDRETTPRRGSTRAKPPFCVFKGLPVFCGPRGLEPGSNVMYRNNGDGSFTDVTEAAGMKLERGRYTLGIVTLDYDNDGLVDIFSGNDSVVNSLWRNLGNGKFAEVGLSTLTALDGAGNPQGCMGVDSGDYDGDGWVDLVVTNFSHDVNTVYRNMGGKFFVDNSAAVGMAKTTLELSWGTGLYDFDNDRDLDLFIANGHVYPEVDEGDVGSSYWQKNHLFTNVDGKFEEISGRSPDGTWAKRAWRGSAFGDFDGDGDVDIAATAMDAPIQLLRNDNASGTHYLRIRLEGTESNRDGIGARVTVELDGKTMTRERRGGGSYLSSSEPELHFGLGPSTRVKRVHVRWPSGRESVRNDVAADTLLRIREPSDTP